MASRYKLMREEALQQALAQAKETVQAQPDDAAAVRRLSVLEQAEVELKSRQQKQAAKNKDPAKTQVQSNEPEVVLQPQKNSKDLPGSYKPTILANDKRVIVACDVHPSGNSGDTGNSGDRSRIKKIIVRRSLIDNEQYLFPYMR